MNRDTYTRIVKEVVPKARRKINGVLAFLMGGFISMSAQVINLILEKNTAIVMEDRMIIIMFIYILLAALLTGFGIFDELVQIFGAGLFIPITGFSNAVCSEAMEYKSEGPIYGIGANMFKLAGSVITYGIVSSIVLTLIYALFI